MHNNILLENYIFDTNNVELKKKIAALKKIVESDNEDFNIDNKLFESVIFQFPNDPFTVQYTNRKNVLESLSNMGVGSFMEKLKSTKLYEADGDIQEIVSQIEDENLPEYGVAMNYNDFIKSLSWNNKLAADINSIEKNIEKNKFWILIMDSISKLESDLDVNGVQDPAIPMLYRSMGLPEADAKHYIMTNCGNFQDNMVIVGLVDMISKMSQNDLNRISYITDRFGRTQASSKISPVQIVGESMVYLSNGHLIKYNANGVSLVNENLDKDFLNLCEAYSRVVEHNDSGITLSTKIGRIKICENKQLHLKHESLSIPQGTYAVKESMLLPDVYNIINESGDQFSLSPDDADKIVDLGIGQFNPITAQINDEEIYAPSFDDALEDMAIQGASTDDINTINTIRNGIENISILNDVMTVKLDSGIVIDRIQVPDAVYIAIVDAINGIKIIKESDTEQIEAASKDLNVNLADMVVDTEEKQKQQQEKLNDQVAQQNDNAARLAELKSNMEELNSSILKLESLDSSEKTDEVKSYYKNLVDRRNNLNEEIFKLEATDKDLDINEKDHMIDSLYGDIESLRSNNQYVSEVNELGEGSIASTNKYKLEDGSLVTCELHASKNDDDIMIDKVVILVINNDIPKSYDIPVNQKHDVVIPEMIKEIIKTNIG